MQRIDEFLKNPAVQIASAFSVLWVANRTFESILRNLTRWIDPLQDLLFDNLWNIDRINWVLIPLIIVGWVAIGRRLNFDPKLINGAAVAFFVWEIIIENLEDYLPDILFDLLSLVTACIPVLAVLLAFSALARIASTIAPTAVAANGGPATPAESTTPIAGGPAPGWFADPKGIADLRWWDGAEWTDHTN